jgi:aspartate racemase
MAAAGLTPLYARHEDATLGAIRSIKAHGPTEAARAALKAASEELLARGARVQMVACTEFSLIADAVAEGVTAFDTLDALVDEIVAFSRG